MIRSDSRYYSQCYVFSLLSVVLLICYLSYLFLFHVSFSSSSLTLFQFYIYINKLPANDVELTNWQKEIDRLNGYNGITGIQIDMQRLSGMQL